MLAETIIIFVCVFFSLINMFFFIEIVITSIKEVFSPLVLKQWKVRNPDPLRLNEGWIWKGSIYILEHFNKGVLISEFTLQVHMFY